MSDVAPASPDPVEPSAPPVDVAPPDPPAAPAAPVDEDAALDAALEKDAITINHSGDKLVPLAAVTGVRAQNKGLKAKVKELEPLAQKVEELNAKLAETAPLADAFRAVSAAQLLQQQAAPATPQAPSDDPLAEEIAKIADLYDEHGQPHREKGKKLADIVRQVAREQAVQESAPIREQALQQTAVHLLERAKVTKINGETVDPDILTNMFKQVAAQPGGWESLADPRNVAVMTKLAHTETMIKRGPGKAAVPPPPPPLYTEAAGGKDAAMPSLNAGDRKVAKELGLSEAQYAKRLAEMPWGKK